MDSLLMLGWLPKKRSARVALILIAIGCLGCFALLFFRSALPDTPEQGYLDMHVHAAGLGYGESGAFVNETLVNSWKFPIYLRAFGVDEEELAERGDRVLLQKISDNIKASTYVHSAVVLALDGVIRPDGSMDREMTQLYVPNDYLIRELAPYPNLHLGASINPLRPDSLERLDYVAENGAVLLKWLPNIMHFDPADERITPFYQRLAELCLPLLTHTGAERSFGEADDSLGDPEKLRLALDHGVQVIAAHIASTGATDGEEHFDRLLAMFETYPNLYADVSSLTQINKIGYLGRALREQRLMPRLFYGTDWPLQFFPLVSPYYQLDVISLREANSVRRLDNVWDRDVVLKKYAGLPEEVFQRPSRLLDGMCND